MFVPLQPKRIHSIPAPLLLHRFFQQIEPLPVLLEQLLVLLNQSRNFIIVVDHSAFRRLLIQLLYLGFMETVSKRVDRLLRLFILFVLEVQHVVVTVESLIHILKFRSQFCDGDFGHHVRTVWFGFFLGWLFFLNFPDVPGGLYFDLRLLNLVIGLSAIVNFGLIGFWIIILVNFVNLQLFDGFLLVDLVANVIQLNRLEIGSYILFQRKSFSDRIVCTIHLCHVVCLIRLLVPTAIRRRKPLSSLRFWRFGPWF